MGALHKEVVEPQGLTSKSAEHSNRTQGSLYLLLFRSHHRTYNHPALPGDSASRTKGPTSETKGLPSSFVFLVGDGDRRVKEVESWQGTETFNRGYPGQWIWK